MARTVRDGKMDSRRREQGWRPAGSRTTGRSTPASHFGYRKANPGRQWVMRCRTPAPKLQGRDDLARRRYCRNPRRGGAELHGRGGNQGRGRRIAHEPPQRACRRRRPVYGQGVRRRIFSRGLRATGKSEKDAHWRAEALICRRSADHVRRSSRRPDRALAHADRKMPPRLEDEAGRKQPHREIDDGE